MADEEPNLYKDTLRTAYTTTVPNARDSVHHGTGQPGDAISSAISSGGWKCAKATEFVTAFSGKCKLIMPKFDEAVSTVKAAYDAEPEKVPAHDPHGLAWPRSWSMQRRMQ
ncbi:hypothetical protein [Kribbella sp. NPDC006257]|uniref:hypothetical protein n=1 Tax=Kribbella sp. NPDC006257 TaxID=3156738 RepID=UPI0033A06A82